MSDDILTPKYNPKERRIDDWLKAFVNYASYGEAPLKTLFWTGVSTIAGALRRKVWIDQKYFQWTPCFYIIIVAPPGIISKSTTANIGIDLLRQVPGIKFGPDVVTWQSLVESMAKSKEAFYNPLSKSFFPMCAVTIASDELGNFLDPTNKDMVNTLIALWDGKKGSFKKETKTSGKDSIENPWINMIGCTTPSWISDNFSENMVGGGYTSRCIFVYADHKRQLQAYPALSVPKDFDEKRQELIEDLITIASLTGEYHLTDEALAWGIDWYEQHWTHRPKHLDNDRFGGYLARKQTHIHKLAMVIAASRSNLLLIDKDCLEFAASMVTALEKELPRVFETIGQNDTTRGMATLVKIVLHKREISFTELYSQLFHVMPVKTFNDAIDSAVRAGYIRLVDSKEGKKVQALKELSKATDIKH